MTATYTKRGLHFLYPENWKLNDDASADLPCAISLEAPDGNAFWSLHLFPPDMESDEILDEVLEELRETYPDLEVSKLENENSSRETKVGIESLEVMFYCLDFLVRVRLRTVTSKQYHCLFWNQAEDRDFDKLELVFKAMEQSVMQGLKK